MSRRANGLLGALFVASGAIALGCEILWFRALSLRFGSTLAATGMLLAVFMTGLAIGGELGARLADRLVRPARGYALAELVIAASAALSPTVFHHLGPLVLTAGPMLRVLLATTLLAPATVAMGATLPCLAAATIPDRAALRDGLGRLYALNVMGAAFGALFTAYVLLPRAGVAASARILAAASLAVAVVAFALAPARADRGHAGTASQPATPRAGDRLAVALAGAIGVLTFALQVAWNRVFALLLGSSAYTFGLVASVILGASALGGTWGRREEGDAWPVVARRCLLFAIAVYLGTLVIFVSPQPLAIAAARHPAAMRWLRLGLVACVVGVPSFVAGSLFPVLAARFPVTGIGRASGRAQFIVTAGNVVGALAASFVGVPVLGAQHVFECIAAAALVAACAASVPSGWDRVRGTALAAVLGVGFAWIVHPTWDRAALSAGTYRVSAWRNTHERATAPCGPSRRFGRHRLLFAREGSLAAVVVLGHPGGPDCSLYSLRINGKAEGSVFVRAPLGDRVPAGAEVLPVGDLPTEVLAGWLPGALAPRARAFLVGWGTGLSTRGLLATGPASVRAVEIEGSVIDAADLFEPATRRDPRVTVVIDDARVALAREPAESFDVIASHPSNPWVVGAGALFSREYFDLARTRLRPGGRMLAWVQLYDTDLGVVRGQIATFHRSFPHTFVLRPSRDARDLLLLGIVPPGPIDRATLAQALERVTDVTALTELRRAGVNAPGELAQTVLADPGEVLRLARGARVHAEDDAWVEFRVADHLLRGDGEAPEVIVEGLIR